MTEVTHNDFLDRVSLAWPPRQWGEHSVVVGVSGGADSVALLLALDLIKQNVGGQGQLIVAHVNHLLRGGESDEDARFVENLADELGLQVESLVAPVPESSSAGQSIEGVLRTSRYQLLLDVARKNGARYLCTAHHANDQAETVLFRILRGTGIDGLAGIPRTRVVDGGVTICRPLLSIDRESICRWLENQNQTWRDDASNFEPRYARNRIRNEVMPVLESVIGTDPVLTLCELAESADEVRQALDQLTDDLMSSCYSVSDNEIMVHAATANRENKFLLGHALRRIWVRLGWPTQEMNRVRWNRVFDAITSATLIAHLEIFELPGGIRVVANGETVTLTRAKA